jgi:pyridoxamine 5'-phosphate oxidase
MTATGNPTFIDSEFEAPPPNPLVLLNKWLESAINIGVYEPRGMVLSTVDVSGRPSSRVVLLKEFDEKGVIFGTHQESRKGKDLALNPWAAGTLWWHETIQQVNFQGYVTRLSKEKSDGLFYARIREAQAVASLSQQSVPLTDEEALKDEILKLMQTRDIIERPQGWHAYHIAVESIEFWHGGKNRFHKRLHYDLLNGTWSHQRLQP